MSIFHCQPVLVVCPQRRTTIKVIFFVRSSNYNHLKDMDHPKSPTHLADQESNSPTWILCKVNVSTDGVANLKKYTRMCFLVKKMTFHQPHPQQFLAEALLLGHLHNSLNYVPTKTHEGWFSK